jgi:hypothetical protein
MKKWFALTLTVASATIALLVLFGLMGNAGLGIPGPALARSAERDDAAAPLSLTVTAVDPTVAPNDLDTPIIITGTGFTAELSGTLVITQPTAYLGATALEDVNWVSTTTLTATVPWGLITGTYTLTVSNPGGESSSLVDAFTVTQGIGVWTTDGPYGGYIVGIEKKPGTPTTIYALASNVGLFASEDAGGSWELIYKSEGSTDLVFDAQDPEVMYYGAADGCFVRTAATPGRSRRKSRLLGTATWRFRRLTPRRPARCTWASAVAKASPSRRVMAGSFARTTTGTPGSP